jgi:NADP-dependent 3-hydroxy acid dehydrogenase YdfG
VASAEACGALAERVGREIGAVSVLVNNAGIIVRETIDSPRAHENWRRVLDVNLTGTFNVVHAFLGALRQTRGDAILIGSVSGSWPDISGSAYQATKSGLLAFARGAGFEEHARGVRFTTVLPGVVDTAILDTRPEPPSAELRAHMLQPEDVAAACLFAATLPPRAHVPELTILPTVLQSVGKTNVAHPPLPPQPG